MSIETTGSASLPPQGWARQGLLARVPPAWVGMSGYLVAGIFLGLVLILALSLTRGGDGATASAAAATTAGAVTDNVTRLHARDIGSSCWRDMPPTDGPARLTVSLEIGIDGKVRYAAASGPGEAMRSCLETHVKSWEFLPQSQPTTMALPIEVDRR